MTSPTRTLAYGGRRWASLLDGLCRLLALAGGLVLVAMALMTVTSVIGRYFFGAPVRGDFELVTLMTGVAVALFLPYCQMRRGHVIVDVFTVNAPATVRGSLDAMGSLLLAAVSFVIAWRLTLGGADLRSAGDESMMLRLPTWWGFLAVVPGFALMGAAAVATFGRDVRLARDGEPRS